ncbi:MAG: alpha/beta hydrolase [Aureispira sp.]
MVKQLLPKAIGYTLHPMSYLAPNQAGDFALHLFGRPMAGRHLPEEKVFLDTAEKIKEVPFELGKVVVYEWNTHQQESVLLLHGWESNAARWEPLIKQLVAEGKRILAVDAPAHGASSGKLFNMLQYSRVLDLLVREYTPNTVVGHSIGGGAVALYLHEHPNTSVQRAAILGVPSELSHMANTFSRILGLSKRMRQTMERRFEEQYQLTFKQVSIAEYCKTITIPMLVVHDTTDTIALVQDAYLYEQHLQDCELVVTKGLGHSLQGQVVYQAIKNFV